MAIIKVLEKVEGCFPKEFTVGEWYDLTLAETLRFNAPKANRLHTKKNADGTEEKTRDVDFHYFYASLGVCMEIPKGYEAIIAPRSSTFKKYGLLQCNSFGIVDQSYSSDQDVWKMPVVATKAIVIPAGKRIAQFRIQLSQKATVWQKIKWLFGSKPKLVRVETLNNPTRGGIGSTGEN